MLIPYAYATEHVAGNDVYVWCILIWSLHGFVAYAADETAALDKDVDCWWNKKFYASHKGVNVDFFISADLCISKVKTDASTESVESGSAELLSSENILVASEADCTTDSLAILCFRNGTLKPLVGITTETVYNELCSNIDE